MESSADSTPEVTPAVPLASEPQSVQDLAALLESLSDSHPGITRQAASDTGHQDRLVLARLGIASGLFAALRAKHPPTASHCLRVALGCSAWSLLMDLTNEERDAIEIAALLHDIGKIGVPDSVLLKPGKLEGGEITAMKRQHGMGQQILTCVCGSSKILEFVQYAGAWYDGSKPEYDRRAEELPLGSRVIAIVDAFDSMTTDHVYRRAMPRERALAELYEGAGTQFDPELVREFCALTAADRVRLDSSVARRWLQEIGPDSSSQLWRLGPSLPLDEPAAGPEQAYHAKLLESMHDGVIFVNTNLRILLWNRSVERLTGVAASSVLEQRWSPELIGLRDENDDEVTEEECPAAHCIQTGSQALERGTIRDRKGEPCGVNLHVMPVAGGDGASHGAVIVIHDATNQITLEERVQSLHVKATQDPLTKVANRAEFDRVHSEFIATHLDEGLPCSLIICDIDHFKRVNDTFGHPAGDDALMAFASVLQSFTRAGDLVARYGGEEFVLLCADCDHAAATRRAEEIRSRVATMPQPGLKNMCITASFGVTGIQAGDTPETMLARADRALLQAKDSGRNRVVQLGTGMTDVDPQPRSKWFSSLLDSAEDESVERQLHTSVPIKVAVAEKLRGFVADHHAEILQIADNMVSLRLDGGEAPLVRRHGDRPVPFFIVLRFHEAQDGGTLIDVTIRPKRQRDRRRGDVQARSQQLLGSLKSYFLAQERETKTEPQAVLDKARHLLSDWLNKK